MTDGKKKTSVVRIEFANGDSYYTRVTEDRLTESLHETPTNLAKIILNPIGRSGREEIQISIVPPHQFGYDMRAGGAYRLHALTTEELEIFWEAFK